MQQIFTQLSLLVVLTGVSVAVVQYLFTNHQTHLKDFIHSLKKIDFDKDNEYDSKLEQQWESALTNCKKHTYFLNPNNSILFGFAIIISLVLVYIVVSLSIIGALKISIFYLNIAIFIIAVALFVWLIANLYILDLIFKKETSIKLEFHEIEDQHQLVDKILNKKR
jgi:hypothetical protein